MEGSSKNKDWHCRRYEFPQITQNGFSRLLFCLELKALRTTYEDWAKQTKNIKSKLWRTQNQVLDLQKRIAALSAPALGSKRTRSLKTASDDGDDEPIVKKRAVNRMNAPDKR